MEASYRIPSIRPVALFVDLKHGETPMTFAIRVLPTTRRPTVTFPVNPSVESLSLKESILPPFSERRLLIADDERVIADTLAAVLSQVGFNTRAVYTGEAALETAEFYLPDVFISDVVMGGLTGIEVAVTLSRTLPDCKSLLFSSDAAAVNSSREAKMLGRTFEVLSKPAHPDDLIQKLLACLSA